MLFDVLVALPDVLSNFKLCRACPESSRGLIGLRRSTQSGSAQLSSSRGDAATVAMGVGVVAPGIGEAEVYVSAVAA